jgi:hypothetical protein
MKYQELLEEEGFFRKGDKYFSPDYYRGKRGLSKDSVLDRIAKQRGYEDYRDLQRTGRTNEYKKWRKWYEEVQGNIRGFDRLYGKARQSGFKPFSKSLVELMRSTTFQNGSDGTWYHGLAWKEYGFGKYR